MKQAEIIKSDLDVTVLLPAFNEEKAIAAVIDDINQVMENTRYQYEILVVDDCSKDRTVEISLEKGARVEQHVTNKGSGAARRTGIRRARGEIIVVLDADGTYSPQDIPKMLEMFPKYDQVNGARTSEEGTLKILRAPTKWFIRKLACYLSKSNIPDLNTGLKAFKRSIMLKYLWVIPDGFSCVTTMTLAFLCNGYNVGWVDTRYHKRIGESKFHPIKDTVKYMMTVIRLIIYFNPLSVFLPLGSIVLAVGLLRWIIVKVTGGEGIFLGPIMVLAAFVIYAIGFLADLIVAQAKNINSASIAE